MSEAGRGLACWGKGAGVRTTVVGFMVALFGAAALVMAVPAAAVVGPTPEECAEADNTPDDCPIYPIGPTPVPTPTVQPSMPTTTLLVIAPTSGPPGLPRTTPPQATPTLVAAGASGTYGVLRVSVLFVTVGLIVLVAVRRREDHVPATDEGSG